MKKIWIYSLVLGIMMIGLATATDSLGTYKQSSTINITYVCSNATYTTINFITNPNTKTIVSNTNMTATGNGGFYYTIINTSTKEIGRYNIIGSSDGCGIFERYIEVKNMGITTGNSVIIVLILAALLSVFSWRVVYRKNKLMGNILYIIIGGGIMYLFAGQGDKLMMSVGIFMLGASIMNTIYDLLK